MSGTVSRSQAIKDSLLGSTAAGNGLDQQSTFTTNLVEMVGIRRFLAHSLGELETQVKVAAASGMRRRDFEEVEAGAGVIGMWIMENLAMVDGALSAGNKKVEEDG